MISTAHPFVLRFSKDERRVFQQNRERSESKGDEGDAPGMPARLHRPEEYLISEGVS